MKIFRLFISLFSLLVFLNSCGYQQTEKDKYPNLPLLPKASTDKFQVTQFTNEEYAVLGVYHDLLYITCTVGNNESGYRGSKVFTTYDASFKEVIKIPIVNSYTYVDIDGNIYCQIDDTLFKYSYPKFKAERIEQFPVRSSIIYNEKRDSILLMKSKNPDFDDTEMIKGELTRRVLKYGSKIKYAQLNEHIILFIGNKTYWMPDDYLDKSKMIKLDFWKNQFDMSIKQPSERLTKFDEAGLENVASGNHFTMSYHLKGLEYFNLILSSDTLQFKYPSNFLNGKSIMEVPSFEKDNEILLISEESDLFLVKHL